MSNFLIRQTYWIPITVGAIIYFIICGIGVLNPLNENWLLGGGDLTQQYFGWVFFRHGPWTFPLGLNPSYGIDISSSIVYSDANPLLALILKLFQAFLPDPFQFQGLWLLVCFIMQSLLAWLLIGLFTTDRITKALGAALFCLLPPMLFRVGVHTNLAAHFFVLGAFYLNLRPWNQFQSYWWILLLLTSLGVHFYLFVMVLALYFADCGNRTLLQKSQSLSKILASFFITILLILIFSWQLGYFTVTAPSLFGYGFFKANILSIFNPNGWSKFMNDLPIKSSWGEGNLYLGLGTLTLILIGLIKVKPRWINTKAYLHTYGFLYAALFFLGLFAISNQIGFGSIEIQLPLPQWLLQWFGILRHSARLFWPLYYAILILGCYLVLSKYSVISARIIFALCLIIQIIDLSPGWSRLRNELHTPIQNGITKLPLNQPFWALASHHYQNVYLLPSRAEPSPDFMARFMASDWRIFGRFAAVNRLSTNAVYLSRYDTKKQASAYTSMQKNTMSGSYDPSTLYIIKNEDVIPVILGLRDPNTLFANIDGFNVLAPDFLKNLNVQSIGSYALIGPGNLQTKLHQSISFNLPATLLSSYALTSGWNNREAWGVWSKNKEAILTLPLPSLPSNNLTLTLRAFVNSKLLTQNIRIFIGGKFIGEYSLSQFEGNTIILSLSSIAREEGYLSIEFELPNAASPASLGFGDDVRELAIGLVSATFN